MTALAATTDAAKLPNGTLTVQNLGAGALYVGDDDVDATNGVELQEGQSIVVTGGGNWVVSASTSDVRYQLGALGVAGTPVAP